MASPFSIFRKHERTLMVIACVMAMVAFVFADPLMQFVGKRGNQDPLVATTIYGDIHESNVQQMMYTRNLANRFMSDVIAAAFGMRYPDPFGPPSEESVVETMLLAKKAGNLGLSISDDAVTRFLREATQDRVTGEQYNQIMQGLSSERGHRASKAQVFEAMRTELAARRMNEMFLASLQTTPAQRWEYYQRLRLRATCEVLPVPVADFLGKISEPANDKLEAFFAAYKEAEPVAGSPEPGFKIPAKVALEYFTAEYDQFFDPEAVTESEVQAHYDKFKDTRYLYSDFGGEDEQDPKPAPADDAAKTPPEESASPGDAPDAPAKEPDAAADAKEPEPQTPDAAARPEAGTSADEENAAPQARHDASGPSSEAARGEALAMVDTATFGLALAAIHQANPDDAPAGDAPNPASDNPAPDATAAEAPALSAPQGAAADKTDSSADSSASVPPTPRAARPPKAEPLVDTLSLPADVREGANPKYDPLWKVEKAIRKELAGKQAVDKMEQVLSGVRNQMRRYGSDRTRWEVRREEDPAALPPKPLDLPAIAAANKLTDHSTKLLPARELAQVDGLGDSKVEGVALVDFAFGTWPVYQTATAVDDAGNRYLLWKTEQQTARVPELAEIRDEVVRAWKMIEGRALAMDRAKALAEMARKEKLTLQEVAAREGLSAHETDSFSWLTQGATAGINTGVPPRLSEVQGVEDAGAEFMQAAFDLRVGDVGTAFNNPRAIAYVIRVTSLQPERTVLEQGFLVDNFRTYYMAAADDQMQLRLAWISNVKREAGLDWVRPPDNLRPAS